MAAVKRARHTLAVPESGTFGALLLSPMVQVRVQGTTFHVHEKVLSKVPFFERMRSGGWADSAAPEVDLPCSAKEFALLLDALYTGRPLGSAALPVEDFSVVMRLMQAADMLLALELYPELPGLLRTFPRSDEQAAAAAEMAGRLPKALGETLRAPTAPVPPETVRQMVLQAAKNPQVQNVATAVLACCSSSEQKEALSEAVKSMLASKDEGSIVWAGAVAREWLDCKLAASAFQGLPAQREVHPHARCNQPQSPQWHVALLREFCAQLERSAAEGTGWCDLLAKGKSTTTTHSHSLIGQHGGRESCMFSKEALLTLDKSCCKTLVRMAKLVDSKSLLEQLAAFPADQLLELVSSEFLKAVSPHAGPLCVALLPVLGKLSSEVAAAVGMGVTGAA